MMNKRSDTPGFTLIEVMIVVVILFSLLAISLPAFLDFLQRTKTSEATSNLKTLFIGASSYYAGENAAQGVAMIAPTTGCLVNPTGRLPLAVSDQKQTFNFTANASFRALGFSSSDPIYFGYTIDSPTPGCAAMNSSPAYTFVAEGDLDGDMTLSRFELATGTNANMELYRSTGFYVVRDTE
ncbi:MAG: prepilin-type N-terminal cleavage/methylation domain-containing protein [Myxococcota bacterium]